MHGPETANRNLDTDMPVQHMMQTAADLWRSDTARHDVPPAPAGPPRAGQFRIDYSQAQSVTLDTGVLREKPCLTGNAPGPFA